MSNLTLKNSQSYFEETRAVNSSQYEQVSRRNFIEIGTERDEDSKSSSIAEAEIVVDALDFLEELKHPTKHKKSSQQTSSEGVYFSTGFKRTRKQIAKVIDIQSELVVLEFIVNKDAGKFMTKNFSPNVFSDINLELNNFIVFNHFRKGNTFKIEISDNQNLISKEELPDYNFDEFSNLFD